MIIPMFPKPEHPKRKRPIYYFVQGIEGQLGNKILLEVIRERGIESNEISLRMDKDTMLELRSLIDEILKGMEENGIPKL